MIPFVLWLALAAAQGEAPWPVKSKLQMPEEHGGMFVLAISPDTKTVAGGTGIVSITVGANKSVKGGEIVLWDPATGKIRKILGKHGSTPSWLGFSPDGKTLGSLSKDDGEFKVWDLAAGKLVQAVKLGTGINSKAAALAFNGRTLVTVEQKSIGTAKEGFSYLFPGALTARDAKTGKTLWSVNDSGAVVMGLSPDGKTLAVFIQKQLLEGGQVKITDRAVQLLDALTGKELRTLERGDLGYADAIGFHQDGKTIYACHHRDLFRWDAQEGKPQPTVSLESWKNAAARAFSPDGKVMAIVEFMGERAGLIDTMSGKTLVEVAAKGSANLWHPAFSSDLKLLACTVNFETLLLGVPVPK